MNDTVRASAETIPLNQKVISCHRESQASFEIMPETMQNFLEMTYSGQHGEDSFNDHALIILIPFANLEIRWVTFSGKETMVGKGHRLIFKADNQRVKMGIIDIGCGTIPASNQAKVVQKETELTTDNPAPVGNALFANLL
jgi:hypothetical protein